MKTNYAIVLAAAAALPAHGLEPTQVFEKVQPSVWIVRTFDGAERPVGQGSAVVIGPGRVVTNCHVLARSKVVMLRKRNVMYEAKLEHADTPRDLCILQVEGFSAPAVEVRPVTDVKVGEKAFAIGNPRGYEVTLSEGLISGLRGEWKDGSHVLQTTAPFSPGSSGGGLFDAEGRLVGITTLIRIDAQNINFAFPASWIAEGQQTLVGWDYSATTDSAAAAYFFVVVHDILERTFRDQMPSELWPSGGDRWNALWFPLRQSSGHGARCRPA